jgi:hypothetical protein
VRKWGGNERDHIWGGGGQETISPVLKIPRQCQFVLLVDVTHMIRINIFMTLERLHYTEI